MSGHGIGHQPQPNPYRVVVSRDSFSLYPPCCGRQIVLGRDGLDITLPKVSQKVQCPGCLLCWQAHLRVSREGLSARWTRAERPA